jgi:hypothetical protein
MKLPFLHSETAMGCLAVGALIAGAMAIPVVVIDRLAEQEKKGKQNER